MAELKVFIFSWTRLEDLKQGKTSNGERLSFDVDDPQAVGKNLERELLSNKLCLRVHGKDDEWSIQHRDGPLYPLARFRINRVVRRIVRENSRTAA